ncbi:MAG: 30S ribosomal protein S2, partial [Flavobacteriaceae bacterium]|nr:30S ribosomal protein S2 [Flavobacteriaceae bacterium]
KMSAIDRMKKDGSYDTLSKKEKLAVDRLRAKLEKNLGSISEMTRLPGALFIVDTVREHIAVKEAQKLNIPIFAMVDTNADPRDVDFMIPSNDDASKSIDKIMSIVAEAVKQGLTDRAEGKEREKETEEEEIDVEKGEKRAERILKEVEIEEELEAAKKGSAKPKTVVAPTATDEEE